MGRKESNQTNKQNRGYIYFWSFAWSNFRFNTFQNAKNKYADRLCGCLGWSAHIISVLYLPHSIVKLELRRFKYQ